MLDGKKDFITFMIDYTNTKNIYAVYVYLLRKGCGCIGVGNN